MIDILITTWPNSPSRMVYLSRTLDALRNNLTATGHDMRMVISAESQDCDESARRSLVALAGSYAARLVWHQGKADLGAHLNFAFGQCGDIRFYCQDDWLLVRPLDLSFGVDAMKADESVVMVRYYTAFTTYTEVGKVWAKINPKGPYPVADNPSLTFRRFMEKCGPYTEGGNFGQHENDMAYRQFPDSGMVAIAPVEVAHNRTYYFEHIGEVSAFKGKRT